MAWLGIDRGLQGKILANEESDQSKQSFLLFFTRVEII
jgi:hypothetical protein